PRPTDTIVSPIWLSAPQVPAFASASSHSFTVASVPDMPSGMCSWIACRSCWPSSRPIVIVNGLNPPAWMLVVPAVSDGENGRLAPGHGLPLGPDVTSKLDDGCAASVPVHGVNDAVVV